jgi:hypothetical protein
MLLAAKVVCHEWLLVKAAPQKALGLCHIPHRLLLWSKLDEVPRDVQTATASDGQCELRTMLIRELGKYYHWSDTLVRQESATPTLHHANSRT